MFLTCQGIYICQQKFKTENNAYINLHFAVLFVPENSDMLTCTPCPRHTLPGHHYDLKVDSWGVQATPEVEVESSWYIAHIYVAASQQYATSGRQRTSQTLSLQNPYVRVTWVGYQDLVRIPWVAPQIYVTRLVHETHNIVQL